MSLAVLPQKCVVVVGAGDVGQALASHLLDKAKSVLLGVRHPDKTKEHLLSLKEDALASTVALVQEAIPKADIILLATPSKHSDEDIEAVAKSLGDIPDGAILVDATNPFTGFMEGLESRWSQGTSGGEVLQKCLPQTKVYKAFNTLGVMHIRDAAEKQMMFCGNGDDESTAIVTEVVAAVGYEPVFVGSLRYSRNLEAMAELWCHCAIPPLPGNNLGNDWTFGIVKAEKKE